MKKLIVALVVVAVIAAAAGGYYYYRGRGGQDLAAAVPVDTLFFAGADGGNGQWMDEIRRLSGAAPSDRQLAQARENLSAYGAAGRMVYGLYAAYSERLSQGKFIPGLGDKPSGVTYTIGLVPVTHLALKDPAAFRAFIDDAEKRAGVTAETGSYQGVNYRRYPLELDGKPTQAALLVAVGEKLGIVTLDVRDFRDQVLPLALNLKSPEKSVAGSGIRERIAKAHGLEKGSLSYLNHRAVVEALTGGKDNLAARMVTALAGDQASELDALRTPACRKDLGAMAEVSPMTVFGWAADNNAGRPLHMKATTEITDQSLVQSLQRLRGHLPGFLRTAESQPVVGVGLGLNMSTLASVVTDVWQRFTSASFQCQWLVEAQQSMRSQNPAKIAMGTLMVSAVRGLSLSLYDLKKGEGTGSAGVKNLDALLTISTEDPQTLITLAQGFLPPLADVKFPADGSPVALPIPVGSAGQLMAAVTKTHIALFVGPKSRKAAASLKGEGLEANGLLFVAADYARLAPILLDQTGNMESSWAARGGKPEAMDDLRESIRQMADMNMQVSESLDVGDKGVTLEAVLEPRGSGQ